FVVAGERDDDQRFHGVLCGQRRRQAQHRSQEQQRYEQISHSGFLLLQALESPGASSPDARPFEAFTRDAAPKFCQAEASALSVRAAAERNRLYRTILYAPIGPSCTIGT